MINSAILITDYSSVAWDFCYLDKPVLFFQPDLDTYLELRGAYLDLRTAFWSAVLRRRRAGRAARGGNRERTELVARYRAPKARYFAFHDTLNCRRIFEEFVRFAGTRPN